MLVITFTVSFLGSPGHYVLTERNQCAVKISSEVQGLPKGQSGDLIMTDSAPGSGVALTEF